MRKKKADISIDEIINGYRQLAFGSISDAVKLILLDEAVVPDDIDKLNLFSVSEIKKLKGGGFEIKFFDRMKALDQLLALELQKRSSGGAVSFFSALEKGAASISLEVNDD